MSTALIEKTNGGPVVTSEQMELIKRTVATGATADELKLYLFDCARQGVHPLDKLVHFTKRQGKYTPITSIDFMRIRAAETGEYAGSDDALFTLGDERLKAPHTATVTVWRLVQSTRCPFTATARWDEYCPDAGPSGKGDIMWKKMPHTMLAKCAEALALRKGFPRQLAGLYAREEMDQAGEANGGYTVHAPVVAGDVRPGASPSVSVAATVVPSVPNGGDSGAPKPTAAELDRFAAAAKQEFHIPLTSAKTGLRVTKVEKAPTKNPNVQRFLVTFSDELTTSTVKEPLGNLAAQLCQDGEIVERKTKRSRFGEDLIDLRRVTPVMSVSEDEPLDADQVPF